MTQQLLFDGETDFSRRENVEAVWRLPQKSREEPRRRPARAQLRIGVLLSDCGTDAEARVCAREHLRTLFDDD